MKILAISYWMPPQIRPQAILLGKMLPEWSSQGINACFVSPNARAENSYGPNISTVPVKSSNSSWKTNKKPYRDIPLIIQTAFDLLNTQKFDVIWTYAKPHLCSVIGLYLKKRTKIPWVAHMSDPWLDNPYESYRGFKKYAIRFLERQVIINSTAIVFVSEETKNLVMKKYMPELEKKTTVIPHCYDPSLYPKYTKTEKNVINFRYIGNFYGNRSPIPLFMAIQKIKPFLNSLKNSVCFEIIGNNPSLTELIRNFELETLVKSHQQVNYARSLELMSSADVLINIDAPAEENVFLPSKLIDYFGASRPILAITPLKGTSARLVCNAGGIVVDPNNISGISEAIIKLAQAHENHTLEKYKPSQEFVSRYHVAEVTKAYRKLFEDIIKTERQKN